MKQALIAGLIVVSMLAACSDDDPFVPTPTITASLTLPDSAGTAEGNSANSSPLGAAQRLQAVYGSALLSGIPNGARITAMRFRLDAGSSAFAAADTFDVFEVRMSTSANAPGSLSATFADNHGSDEVIVRDGPLTIDPSDYPTGGTPNGWGKAIPFAEAFVYRGGDLLVEIAVTGLSIAGRLTDNVFPSSTDSQTGYGTGFNATTADAGLFQDLIVVQYVYSYQ